MLFVLRLFRRLDKKKKTISGTGIKVKKSPNVDCITFLAVLNSLSCGSTMSKRNVIYLIVSDLMSRRSFEDILMKT